VTDKLIKKEPLNSSEYCHVTRELGRDIKKITLHPHPEAYRHMSKMFLTAYPHLALKNGGLERTVVSSQLRSFIVCIITNVCFLLLLFIGNDN
jgi:hypothetical protein